MAVTSPSASADTISLHTLDLDPDASHSSRSGTASPPLPTTSTPPAPRSHRSSRELALRSELPVTPSPADAASATARSRTSSNASSHGSEQERLEALQQYATKLFASHKNGENDDEINALARQRALRLQERGEDPEIVQSAFGFGDTLNALSNGLTSAGNATGFAVANIIAGQAIPHLDSGPAQQGSLSGILTYVLLHVGSNINETMTAHTPWTKPEPELLAPAMQAAVTRRAPTTAQQFKEKSLIFQAFPGAFVVGGLATSAFAQAGTAAAATAKSVIGPITSLAGGAIVGTLERQVDKHQGRAGPALILASENWEEKLDALKNGSYLKSMSNGIKHLSTDTRAKFMAGITEAARQAKLPSTAAKAAVWTGGLALSSWASAQVTALMKERGFSDAEIFTAQQVMFPAGLIPITLAWTTLITLGPLLDDKVKQALSAVFGSPSSARPAITHSSAP